MLVLDLSQKHFPHGRRIRQVDIAGNIQNGHAVRRSGSNLHSLISLRFFFRLGRCQIFHHAQQIFAILAAKFYYVHALLHKVKPQTAGANFFERPAAKLGEIDGRAGVRKKNFQAAARFMAERVGRQAPARDFDGEASLAFVGVANDVGEGFVNGADNGARFGFRKMYDLGGSLQSGANETKRFGITLQRQP